MQDDSSTFGLNREKLSKLWELGEDLPQDQDNLDNTCEKAELLQQQLAESLPLDAGMAQMLPDLLNVVCEKLKPFTGCSFQALLLDPETDSQVIQMIKEIHKKQWESASSPLRKEIAATIYYAAIACSLVHHHNIITSFSYQDLAQSFDDILQDQSLPSGLKDLITKAHEQCCKHIKK